MVGAVHKLENLPVRGHLAGRQLFAVLIAQKQHKVVRGYAAADFMLPQVPEDDRSIPGKELVPVMIAEDVIDVFEI